MGMSLTNLLRANYMSLVEFCWNSILLIHSHQITRTRWVNLGFGDLNDAWLNFVIWALFKCIYCFEAIDDHYSKNYAWFTMCRINKNME